METLQLSQEVLEGLQSLGSISEAQYEEVSRFCVESLVKGRSGGDFRPDEANSALTLAVATVFTEASKLDMDADALSTALDDAGLGKEVSVRLVKSFGVYRGGTVFHMQGTAIDCARVVDLDWRIDYSIRSKDAGRDNEPVVFVTLHVSDKGRLRDIDMVCSHEELKSLVATLRDGCKEVERLIKAD